MNRTNYESPKMKFVKLYNKERIASTCWGYHGTGTNLYYDIGGVGWVSFQIAAGSCTLNLTNVYYYADRNDPGTLLTSSDPRYTELYNALLESGGATGNPYKGEGTVVFPDNPDSNFS